MSEPLIVLDHLAKSFGDHVAVDALSMSIPKGEVFGFLGANGAGKTTTIRMLCGLTKPTGGNGSIGGLDVWKDRYQIRSSFGYVAQKFSLYPDLTVLENLRFFGSAYRVHGRALEKPDQNAPPNCWTYRASSRPLPAVFPAEWKPDARFVACCTGARTRFALPG